MTGPPRLGGSGGAKNMTGPKGNILWQALCNKSWVAIVLFACAAGTLYAAEEPWYLNLYIGFPITTTYPGLVTDEVDILETSFGPATKYDNEFEVGVYGPIEGWNKCVVGLTYTAIISGFHGRDNGNKGVMPAATPGIAVSFMRFYGEEIGMGPFIRGDIGLMPYVSVDSDITDTNKIEHGHWGALLCAGYGWRPESWDTRLSIQVHYQVIDTDSGKASSLSLGVGWLF
jgi:hypothetical protein